MATSAFEDLISDAKDGAKAPGYVSSLEFRARLEQFVTEFTGGTASVKWIPPGGVSNWNGQSTSIELETPQGVKAVPDELVARMAATVTLHECLHWKFSGPMPQLHSKGMPPPAREHALAVFLLNHLEDARIARLGVAEDPTIDPYLAAFHSESNRQALQYAQHFFSRGTRQFALLEALLAYAHGFTSPLPRGADAAAVNVWTNCRQRVDEALISDIAACGEAAEDVARRLTDPGLS